MYNIRKEVITKDNMVKDIKKSLDIRTKMNASQYNIIKAIGIIVVVAFIVSEIIILVKGVSEHLFFVYVPILSIIIIFGLFKCLITAIKKVRVRVEDYEVVNMILSHRAEEKHIERVSKYRRKEITVYTLHFEGDKVYRIPEENFEWAPIRTMSDSSLFNLLHRGDECLVVLNKKTGKIAVVYPVKYFEYSNLTH